MAPILPGILDSHATIVGSVCCFWQELYSLLSARLESGTGAIAFVVNISWEKVHRPSTARYRQYLCIFLRLVHGSLARAGKVKSQTPKVEPQEKKKNPKGRAKKRMLYNRRCVPSPPISLCPVGLFSCSRFVNVTTLQQGGKRRM